MFNHSFKSHSSIEGKIIFLKIYRLKFNNFVIFHITINKIILILKLIFVYFKKSLYFWSMNIVANHVTKLSFSIFINYSVDFLENSGIKLYPSKYNNFITFFEINIHNISFLYLIALTSTSNIS